MLCKRSAILHSRLWVAYKGAVTSFIRWYQQTGQADAYRGVLAWKAYMRDDLGACSYYQRQIVGGASLLCYGSVP